MRARHLQLLAGITLAGAALRFATLDAQSYWLDEAATVNILRHSFGGMLSAVSAGESTPHLYYIVAWFWSKLFGTGEVGLRSLSALIGTATIPLAFALGRRIAGLRAGLIAAAMCAFNPLLVWYSQEARSYALMILLTGLTLLAVIRALEEPTRGRFAVWALLSVAAIATHYFAGFLIGAEAAWLLYRTAAKRSAAIAVGGIAVAAAALLPLALHQRSTGAAAFISQSSILRRLAQVPKQFVLGYHGPLELPALLASAVLLAYAAFRLVRSGASRASVADAAADEPPTRGAAANAAPLGAAASPPTRGAAAGAAPLVRAKAAVLAGLGVAAIAAPFVLALLGPDYLIARNVIAAWLPLSVAAAAGFAAGRAPRAGVAAAAGLCAIGIVMIIGVAGDERYQRDNWRGAAKALGTSGTARAIIVTPPSGRIPLLLYLKNARPVVPPGVDVKELDMVGLAPRLPGQAPNPPRPPVIAINQFSEFARTEAKTYTVVREGSAQNQHIESETSSSPLDGRPGVMIYQEPAAPPGG